MRAGRWTMRAVAAAVGAVVASATLVAACSSGGDNGDTTQTSTSSTNADGTTSPGTTVQIGDPIVVKMANAKDSSTIRLTVTAVKKGTIKDLSDFILDKSAKSSSVYYVHTTAANIGKGDLGGSRLTLYGKVSDSLVVQPVRFGSTFAKCNDRPLPTPFGAGKKATGCLVLLAPQHGQISQVQWRSDSVAPIGWDIQAQA